jgi:hypothetical protein
MFKEIYDDGPGRISYEAAKSFFAENYPGKISFNYLTFGLYSYDNPICYWFCNFTEAHPDLMVYLLDYWKTNPNKKIDDDLIKCLKHFKKLCYFKPFHNLIYSTGYKKDNVSYDSNGILTWTDINFDISEEISLKFINHLVDLKISILEIEHRRDILDVLKVLPLYRNVSEEFIIEIKNIYNRCFMERRIVKFVEKWMDDEFEMKPMRTRIDMSKIKNNKI